MQAKEHANLLGIFAWVYAGFQGLFVLFFLLYVLFLGGMGVFIAISAKDSEVAGLIVYGVMALIFGLICLFGLICMIANIRMGRHLRRDTPPTQRTMIVTAILNFLSWMFGGIFLLPFGIALGVYGLWFTLSDTGKAYLSGQAYLPNYAYPPNPQFYPVNQMQPPNRNPHDWQ